MIVQEDEDNEGFSCIALDCECNNHIIYLSQHPLLTVNDIKFCPKCGKVVG